MFLRVLALLLVAAVCTRAQEAYNAGLPDLRDANGNHMPAESAWLDLRQNAPAHSKAQDAPRWVETVTLVPVPATAGAAERTIFRIRVTQPRREMQLLLMRLFFEDKPEQRPQIVAWDESGTQVLRSGLLGAGIDLPSSDTVTIPMAGVSSIDVEVPGDGKTVRGAYLDWMVTRNVAHPFSAEARDVMPEPFMAAGSLHAPEQDTESFGTVTATLAPDVIRIGASVQQGAAFQFGIEAQPLMALLAFEISTAYIDAPPEVYVNGVNLGPVSLTLPHLADPGYRGEAARMIAPMRFRYTGWVRAQKLVPGANLKVGANDVIVIGGPGTPDSAIRATQIQLKYLWDKSDYLLDPK
ncbi:MAG: hypothetical protein ACR2ID_10755 [Chthoniobacterales bacterium]